MKHTQVFSIKDNLFIIGAVSCILVFVATAYVIFFVPEKSTEEQNQISHCIRVAEVQAGAAIYKCSLDDGVVCYIQNGSGSSPWCFVPESK